jgi:hypothetical protein
LFLFLALILLLVYATVPVMPKMLPSAAGNGVKITIAIVLGENNKIIN